MTNNKLEGYATRIDRLEEERAAIGVDIKEIYTEVKSAGFNPKALRKVLAERRKPNDAQYEAELDAYRAALGMHGTYRKAADALGVSKSKLQRLVPRKTNGTTLPPHDRETGEIPPEQERPEPQSPVGQSAPFEDTEERGAPNVPCDGEASAAITTASALPSPPIDELEPPSFLKRERVA